MQKKYLIVTRGDAIGGATEYLLTMMASLHENFAVEIHMTYSKAEIRDFYLQRCPYVVFHNILIKRSVTPFGDLQSIWRLAKLMRREQFAVVHTNTSKGGIVGRMAAKMAKMPFVFHTVHGFAFHEQSSRMSMWGYMLLEKVAAKCCHYIITVSDYHRDLAIGLKIAGDDKIISIPNGLCAQRVVPTVERADIRQQLQIGEQEVAVFAVGRLAKQKGLAYLLEAVALLAQDPPREAYHLYLAGSGELEGALKGQVEELGIDDKVTFLGFRRDVNNLLAAADVLVIPSLWEGLSISLLEGMAAQKAIICTEIGSNLTVVEDMVEARIVKSRDPLALKEALTLLIDNERLRRELAKNAYERFKVAFTKETMLEGYFRFFKNIVGLVGVEDDVPG